MDFPGWAGLRGRPTLPTATPETVPPEAPGIPASLPTERREPREPPARSRPAGGPRAAVEREVRDRTAGGAAAAGAAVHAMRAPTRGARVVAAAVPVAARRAGRAGV